MHYTMKPIPSNIHRIIMLRYSNSYHKKIIYKRGAIYGWVHLGLAPPPSESVQLNVIIILYIYIIMVLLESFHLSDTYLTAYAWSICVYIIVIMFNMYIVGLKAFRKNWKAWFILPISKNTCSSTMWCCNWCLLQSYVWRIKG